MYCIVCAHQIAEFSKYKYLVRLEINLTIKDLDISRETMVVGKVLSKVTEDNSTMQECRLLWLHDLQLFYGYH